MRLGLAAPSASVGQPDLSAFVTEANRAWARHWWSLPRDMAVPVRSVFNPMAVPSLLPHMMIYDLSEPEIVRIRLMGTSVVASFGFDPTGRDYLDLVDPARREAAYGSFTDPAGHPCGMRVVGESCYANGNTLKVETVGFPFWRDDGAGTQMVFVRARLDDAPGNWPNFGPATGCHVFERQFIDIGAGVP